jgi:hypothetical protein
VKKWLGDNLEPDERAAIEAGNFTGRLNRNFTEGAPNLAFGSKCTLGRGQIRASDKAEFAGTNGLADETSPGIDGIPVLRRAVGAPPGLSLRT